jgi:hypothetical protein
MVPNDVAVATVGDQGHGDDITYAGEQVHQFEVDERDEFAPGGNGGARPLFRTVGVGEVVRHGGPPLLVGDLPGDGGVDAGGGEGGGREYADGQPVGVLDLVASGPVPQNAVDVAEYGGIRHGRVWRAVLSHARSLWPARCGEGLSGEDDGAHGCIVRSWLSGRRARR